MAANVKMVNLYYLGGFSNEQARVSAKGNVYRVPPPGESLLVPAFIARDLMRRNRYQGKSLFTTDGALAKSVVAARKNGEAEATPKFTRQQLLDMLEELPEELQEDMKAAAKKSAAKKEEVN